MLHVIYERRRRKEKKKKEQLKIAPE